MSLGKIEEALPFQRRQWQVQRFFWAVLALLIAGCAAGLAGSGPFADRTSFMGGGWELVSPRFSRLDSPTRFELTQRNDVPDVVSVHLGGDFADSFVIEHVWPAPVSSRRDSEGLELRFGPGTSRITLQGRPSNIGLLRGRFAVDGTGGGIWAWVNP
jgi:hypothetical protein